MRARPVGTVTAYGGRPIHWSEVAGVGPTVVFANGCGLAREHWQDVTALLPGRHLVTFDRPGMGGTPWPGTMSTLAEEVASLADLIADRGGPAVVVAHSMAGFHAEALARRHPGLVAGLVLVDASVEFLAAAPTRWGPGLGRTVRAVTRLPALSHLGVLAHRVGASWQSRLNAGHDWDPRFGSLYRDPDALAMGAAESQAYWTQAWDLLRLRGRYPLPPVPAVVLTALEAPESRDWVLRQHRYARLLDARQVVVTDSRHLMMIDHPGVIARAVAGVAGVSQPTRSA